MLSFALWSFFSSLGFLVLALFLGGHIIHSLLLLILIFLGTGVLFLLVGAEYLGFLVVLIYAGALSILFLFVIMLLDIREVELQNKFFNLFSLGFFLGAFLFIQLGFTFLDYFDFYLFNSFFPSFDGFYILHFYNLIFLSSGRFYMAIVKGLFFLLFYI